MGNLLLIDFKKYVGYQTSINVIFPQASQLIGKTDPREKSQGWLLCQPASWKQESRLVAPGWSQHILPSAQWGSLTTKSGIVLLVRYGEYGTPIETNLLTLFFMEKLFETCLWNAACHNYVLFMSKYIPVLNKRRLSHYHIKLLYKARNSSSGRSESGNPNSLFPG